MATLPTDREDAGADPASAAFDAAHLARMTLGDPEVERQVLSLFERQSAMLTERLCAGPHAVGVSCAHTLKGAARGIGAWEVAHAAERVEQAGGADEQAYRTAVAQLLRAVEAACAAIARHLRP